LEKLQFSALPKDATRHKFPLSSPAHRDHFKAPEQQEHKIQRPEKK